MIEPVAAAAARPGGIDVHAVGVAPHAGDGFVQAQIDVRRLIEARAQQFRQLDWIDGDLRRLEGGENSLRIELRLASAVGPETR